jgi:hypothetical protein
MSNTHSASHPGGQTTDATPTTVATYAPADGTALLVHAQVLGRKSDGSQVAGYELLGVFRRSGASTSQVGSTTVSLAAEDDPAWDAGFSVSGTDILLQVTGAAGVTIDWVCQGHVTEV